MEANPKGYFPFPLFEGSWRSQGVTLLLTGTGRASAGMAVAAWLSHQLRDLGACCGSGLLAPALMVANFGTAGAYQDTHQVGQTLLVHKVLAGSGQSIFPERLVSWAGSEAECRTVPKPQREILGHDLERGRQPLFDMEAYGVAEATLPFLSSAHLVIGKCVLDWIGPEGDGLDFKALGERVQSRYDAGARDFLDHVEAHRQALAQDGRRLSSLSLATDLGKLMQASRERLPLTVTQQRELAQGLRGRLALCRDDEQKEQAMVAFLALLPEQRVDNKPEVKARLAVLLQRLIEPSAPSRG